MSQVQVWLGCRCGGDGCGEGGFVRVGIDEVERGLVVDRIGGLGDERAFAEGA